MCSVNYREEELTPEQKEQMLIKQNAIKDKIVIKNIKYNFKNLFFTDFADNKEIIEKARAFLKTTNSYAAKPQKIIIKEKDYETNVENLTNEIKEIQKSGRWLIPSPASTGKWYETRPQDIKACITELFKLYGEDYFTIILKDKKTVFDVFWDEECEGIYAPEGVYCIFKKRL